MAHLQRELFISLVMDSASDWMVVRVPIIEFIRNVAALHAGAKPRISYILYSAADTRPSPIDTNMFFCKGEQAHFAIQSLQAASRNYIRGRLGSAVLEGLVRSIEFFDQAIEEGSSPDSFKYMVLVANNPPDESKRPIHNISVEMDNMDWDGLDGALKKRHIYPCFFLPRSTPLDKITELAKRCGAEKTQADVNNLYEIYVSGPKSQPPAVTPTHQPIATLQPPYDSPPAKRKREEPSPAPNPKVRKLNPPVGKTPPVLDPSPPKPPMPISAPIPAPPPAPVVAQPPQPTVPPNDSITTMEQYQQKLENIKLKLSSMPREQLQQSLAQFRSALNGLGASITTGKVPADRVTQHRLDRQILADVLRWSVEFLESNRSSASAPSTSTLSQSSASKSQPLQSQPPQTSHTPASGPSQPPNPPTNVPANQAVHSQTVWQGCIHLIGGRKAGDSGEPVSLLAYCTAKLAKGQLTPMPFSDRMNVITARQDVESKAVVEWLSHLERAPDNILYLIDGAPPPEISSSPSYVPSAAVRSIFEEYKLVGIGKLPDQDGNQPASTVVLFGVPAFHDEVLGAAIFLNQDANLESLRTGRPIINGPEIIEKAKLQGQLLTRGSLANPFNHLAVQRNQVVPSVPGLGQGSLGAPQLMGNASQQHNSMNTRLPMGLNPNAAAILASLRDSGVTGNTFLGNWGGFPPTGGQQLAPTNPGPGLMNNNPNPNPLANLPPTGFSVGPHSLSMLDAQNILTGLREGRVSRDSLRPEVLTFLFNRGAAQRNQMAPNGMGGNMGALGGGAGGTGMGGMNGLGGMGGFGGK